MQEPESPGYEDVVDSWSVGIVIYTFVPYSRFKLTIRMLTKMLPFDDEADIPVSVCHLPWGELGSPCRIRLEIGTTTPTHHPC